MIDELLSIVIAYLLGSIPFGYLIVKTKMGKDVRDSGSGSIGATNVLRTAGRWGGILTFVCDVGKGYVAVLIAQALVIPRRPTTEALWVVAAAALAAILGHVFPVFLKFKGGKGVATGVGVFLAIYPLAVGAVLIIFVFVVAIWRYISLGSIVATSAFPLFAYLLGRHVLPFPILAATVAGAALIVIKHSANIQRLFRGTENRFAGFSRKAN